MLEMRLVITHYRFVKSKKSGAVSNAELLNPIFGRQPCALNAELPLKSHEESLV